MPIHKQGKGETFWNELLLRLRQHGVRVDDGALRLLRDVREPNTEGDAEHIGDTEEIGCRSRDDDYCCEFGYTIEDNNPCEICPYRDW